MTVSPDTKHQDNTMSDLSLPQPVAPWFSEAKFGLFIHYGLYAILERGEQVLFRDTLDMKEYNTLTEQFTAEHLDPEA